MNRMGLFFTQIWGGIAGAFRNVFGRKNPRFINPPEDLDDESTYEILGEIDESMDADLLDPFSIDAFDDSGEIGGGLKDNGANNAVTVTREENQFLPVFTIKDTSPEAKDYRRRELLKRKYRSIGTIFDVGKVAIDLSRINNESTVNIRFKDTDCIFVIPDRITIIAEDESSELNVFVERIDEYYHFEDEPSAFPCKFLGGVDDDTLKLFEPFEGCEAKWKAIIEFGKLTKPQQDFIRRQASKPPCDTSLIRNEPDFAPVMDPEALTMMYKAIRHIYSPSRRAVLDQLIEEMNSPLIPRSERSDLAKQIGYTINLDTDVVPHITRTYDEVIAILDKYIYGMTALKAKIVLRDPSGWSSRNR